MPSRLLDTNVLIRYFTRDDEAKAERVKALLTRVAQRQETVVTTPMVIFETVFTLQRSYRYPRHLIRERVLSVLDLPGLTLPNKRRYGRALDLYVAYPRLSFADAFNVATMEALNVPEIYTWDEGFDGLPGVTRVEPDGGITIP